MFGDNGSVFSSASIPPAKLQKCHVALSFHIFREAITEGIMTFTFLAEKDNPAGILSKQWGYQQVLKLLQPILFWRGDTMDIISNQDKDGTKDGKISDSPVIHINGE